MIKVSLKTINTIEPDTFVQTRWGDDLIHIKVLSIIENGDRYKKWTLWGEISNIDMDFYA